MIARYLTAASLLFATTASAEVHIDHVMIGTADLRAGMIQLEHLTGVRPAFGGVHPGRGTQNALLSLGPGTYLELIAPDPAQHSRDPDVLALRRLKRLTPVGWAVSAADARSLRQRAAAGGFALTAPEAGSRRRPDGTILRWSTFGYASFPSAAAPFFIHWSDARLHPSRTSPGGCRFVGLKISDPHAAPLRRAITPLRIRATVVFAEASQMRVTLACSRGRVTLG